MLVNIQTIFRVPQEAVQVVPRQEDLGAQEHLEAQGNLVQVVGDIVRDQAHREVMQVSQETRVGGHLAQGSLILPMYIAVMVQWMIWFQRKGVAVQKVADEAAQAEVLEVVVVQEIAVSLV